MLKSKWSLLLVILAVLLAFSLLAVPKIVTGVMNETKGQINTVEPQTNY
jgi:hypothetical protein